MIHPSLKEFHPLVAQWFAETFGEPTPPQAEGWPRIAAGENLLLLAPTGSGKTLAAFLKVIDRLYQETEKEGSPIGAGVKILYVSPLKALNNDIDRNLELPLQGIKEFSAKLGQEFPEITRAVRSGDTSAAERQRMLRRPPQILITTPESLFLMLSSKAREILKTVRCLILDEIHTLFMEKRGAHLALSIERLQNLVEESADPGKGRLQRIGLSATIRPLDEVAAFLGGYEQDARSGERRPRPVTIIDTGQRKELDLQITLPVPSLRELPEKTIWPSIYQKITDLVRQHRATLVFVNNRRLAERVTANINRIAGQEIARTHHGSLAREIRLEVERRLKSAELPCVVATASLELGIDVGEIDLVIQLESPKEVARGLQRVGRAGHVINMPSKGRVIPKNRADLLEAVALLQEMKSGRVEKMKAPMNCLDILAQQLVAMTATGAVKEEQAYQIIRSAYNYHTLSRTDLERVLTMLSGSYEAKEYLDLRPRLYWERAEGVIKPDSYGKRLVYIAGGTIPDRGYFSVYLAGSNLRLGELDEEFVYERRLNERFVLGTSVWRIEEIRQDRVIVSPAGKGEAQVPFWRADQGGRSYELGQRIGAFLAELEGKLEGEALSDFLREKCGLCPEATKNLQNYLVAQKRAVDYLPTDRRMVLEEFPDEAGEWRLLLHSTLGNKIHLPLALLLGTVWEERLGKRFSFITGDDGIMFSLPGGITPPAIDWSALKVEEIEEQLGKALTGTPLFGAVFRHCAQRSLVMPRGGFGGKRQPLWLARIKADNLLQTVAKYQDFPLVIETYREIFQDYLDLGALREVLRRIQEGEIEIYRKRRLAPSPFAHGHLFNFVAGFMYDTETPKVEGGKRLFGLGAETLKTIVGKSGFRDLFRTEVIKAVDSKARGIDLLAKTIDEERVRYWLERSGEITDREIDEAFPQQGAEAREVLSALCGKGRAVLVEVSAMVGETGELLYVNRDELDLYLSTLTGAKVCGAEKGGPEESGQAGAFEENPYERQMSSFGADRDGRQADFFEADTPDNFEVGTLGRQDSLRVDIPARETKAFTLDSGGLQAGAFREETRGRRTDFLTTDPTGRRKAKERIIQRFVRTHGPFTIQELVARYGWPRPEVEEMLAVLASVGLVESGEFIPGGEGEEWCDTEVLREIHRRSLARARQEIKARTRLREPRDYAVFLARWQGVTGERREDEGLAETLSQLAGRWFPAASWERYLLPARVKGYKPLLLDRLFASGQFQWRARGGAENFQLMIESPFLPGDGWDALSFSGEAPLAPEANSARLTTKESFDHQASGRLAPSERPAEMVGMLEMAEMKETAEAAEAAETAETAETMETAETVETVKTVEETTETVGREESALLGLSAAGRRILDLLKSRGAETLPFLLRETQLPTPSVWQALEELILNGLITNDSFGPIRYMLSVKPQARVGAQGVLQPALMARMGRWSLLPPLTLSKERLAQVFLNRYGIVCREIVQAEGASWGEFYPLFGTLEDIGRVKRGYFIKGLSGIQYALPQALGELGAAVNPSHRYWALSWSDPANPLNYLIDWPQAPETTEPKRTTGDYLVFEDGRPIMVASGQQMRLQTLESVPPASLEKGVRALVGALDPVYQDKKIIVSSFNGEPAQQSPVKEVLRAIGFEDGYQKMTLWPSDRDLHGL